MATRRERVLLELEDNFTSGMVRAAAATQLLDRNLKSLSGHAVGTNRDLATSSRSIKNLGDESDRTGKKVEQSAASIDKYSGRLGLLVRAAAALGPALVPIGAAAVPALTGLAAGFGAAAGAAGVAVLAFNGVGDALKALDTYQVTPTEANLAKLRVEMDKLGPSGAQFVRYLDQLEPTLRSLQMTARDGFFPQLEVGIDALLTRLPEVRQIISGIATEMGSLAEGAGRALGGPRFDAFFRYLSTDAVPTLHGFAVATGNVVEGLANLTVAFAPLTRNFTTGLESMTEKFANWTAGLSKTQGFQDFVAYIQASGPQVLDLLGQIALTLASVVEAAAPVGQITLPALRGVAHVIETIAASDLGTPLLAGVAAMSALRLATAAWGKVAQTSVASFVAGQGKAAASILTVTSAQDRARLSATELAAVERQRTATSIAGFGRMAAVFAGLTIASTGAADSIGLTNSASMALMGSFAGPWGAAVGGAVGLTMDLAAANDDLEGAIRRADSAMQSMDVSQMQAQLESLNQAISDFDEKTTVHASWNPFAFSKENIDAVVSGVSELATGTRASAEAKRDDVKAAIADREATQQWFVGQRAAAKAARMTRTEIEGLVSAMLEQRSAALKAFDAVTQYGQALADARKQARQSEAGINANTEAGSKNRQALSQLAAAWNNQSEAVRNNTGKWREARAAFIQTATAMGVPIDRAKQLADRLMAIPEQRVIDIKMYGSEQAADQLARIRAEVTSIPQVWRTTYYVNQVNSISRRYVPGGIPGADGKADGGTIPKDGMPYADRYLYWLAPGEEVISNRRGQADRFRADRAAGRIPGYADGGTVASYRGSAGDDQTPRSLKELRAALKAATASIQDETTARDALRQRMQDIRSGVAQGLHQDIFGGSSNPWGGSADPLSIERANLARAHEFTKLVHQLKAKGVDGAALQEIVASGDIERARLMAGMSRSYLSDFERVYRQEHRATAQAGAAVNQALGLTREARLTNRHLEHLTDRVKQLEHTIKVKEQRDHHSRQQAADRTTAGVNGAAKGGHRHGQKG